jgi:6-pyruvoyltetrahydropterin/6-carboxytetrahydropterin synthase
MVDTTLHLYKQNFKFSSAHFLIFDEHRAEKLHGHNYQVSVEILGPLESHNLNGKGFYIDFNVFKKAIKQRLDQWDEMVLLPARHPEMKINKKAASLEVHFRERFYVFPENEVCLLPVTNTSVEQLSKILAEDFFSQFKNDQIRQIMVMVEETPGQGASTRVSI